MLLLFKKKLQCSRAKMRDSEEDCVRKNCKQDVDLDNYKDCPSQALNRPQPAVLYLQADGMTFPL